MLVAGCIAAAGCGDSEGGESGAVDVARAYVEAIDERDGERFCDLVAPYISGTLELEIKDPDSNVSGVEGCGEFISGFIGYTENAPEFIGARVVSANAGERNGRLQAVELELEIETKEDELVAGESREVSRTETIDDVVWLAEFDGEWRVAKLSTVAQAASLAFTIGEGSAEDDPLAPPDLEAQLRAYAAEQTKSEKVAEEREASYAEPGDPTECEGLAIQDPAGDLVEYVHPAPDEPAPPTPQADLRRVQLSPGAERFCVQFVAEGNIEGPVTFSLNLRDSAAGSSFIQIFDVDLRSDGLVRVTSGQDDEDHPIPVPAEVGLGGEELTLVLTPESFSAGEPTPSTTGSRPTDRFAFMASATAQLGERRALHDDLGPSGPANSFAYPSGEPCVLGEPSGQPDGC